MTHREELWNKAYKKLFELYGETPDIQIVNRFLSEKRFLADYGVAKYFDMGDMAVMIAPKQMVIVSATEDEWFPLDGAKKAFEQVKEIYRAAGAEDKCAMVVGEGPHRFYAGLAWPVVFELLSK